MLACLADVAGEVKEVAELLGVEGNPAGGCLALRQVRVAGSSSGPAARRV